MKKSGKTYWRSLDELAGKPEFRAWLTREFPEHASEMLDGSSRRTLLKLMAASFGLAGLTACRRPSEKILPAFRGNEVYTHGVPLFYATAFPLGGFAHGLLVETNDGRPTKVEGNPDHPSSKGAASAFAQASVLAMYDPDRLRHPLEDAKETTWEAWDKFAAGLPDSMGAGDGVRILSGTVNSPTLESVRGQFLSKFPNAKWVEYEPVSQDEVVAGAQAAFGQPLLPNYQFGNADVVVALDCDFLGVDSPSVSSIRDFSLRRKVSTPSDQMSRLYAVEPNFTITGATADHRLRIRPSEVLAFAAELARAVGALGTGLNVLNNNGGEQAKWVAAIAKDLQGAQGRSLVLAGPRQPAAVHAAVHAINQALGNIGQTVTFQKPPASFGGQVAGIKALAGEIAGGSVKTLLILGGNPVFDAPADCKLADALPKAGTVIHLADEANETSGFAKWVVPQAHYLESWGDARAIDGTVSIQQPMIQPLFGGKSAMEVVAVLAGVKESRGFDLVHSYWTSQSQGADAEKRWRKALHDGLVLGTASAPLSASLNKAAVEQAVGAAAAAGQGIDIEFYPSSSLYDGRYANNGWLQEVPDPITKVTWDNAALLSQKTADSLGIKTGDMVAIEQGGNRIDVPAMIQPGHADGCVSLELGYGRTACGHIGDGVGHNVYPLRTSAAMGFLTGGSVRKTGATYELVTTQEHHSMEGRDIVREASLEEYRKDHKAFEGEEELPLFKLSQDPVSYEQGYQWGMAIDLTSCIGCNACVIACQSENNIPIVGKDQVQRGREMHWIRLDRYYTGETEDPQLVYQPMTCQHCESAPCENVCPVAATVHSEEGLNVMVYNRCIGTRYCSNNCPYKVRRFNFLAWHDIAPEAVKPAILPVFHEEPDLQRMVHNPDVSVRARGVMEKCTYCVQRIQEKKIAAKKDGRRQLKDGEVVTACQQTCPADAIVFGNINDPDSRVAKVKKFDRNYALLAQLNVRPRTTYLAKVRNPNPELA